MATKNLSISSRKEAVAALREPFRQVTAATEFLKSVGLNTQVLRLDDAAYRIDAARDTLASL